MNISKRGFFKWLAIGFITVVTIIIPGFSMTAGEPKLIRREGTYEEFKCEHWRLGVELFRDESTKHDRLVGLAIPYDKFYPRRFFSYNVDGEMYKTDGDYKTHCIEKINELLAKAYKDWTQTYFKKHA